MYDILIVDDNIDSANITKNCLLFDEKNRFRTVEICINGEDASEFLKKNTVDLILLDLIMPVKDGFYVLENLDKLNLGVRPKVIVFTASNHEPTFNKVYKLGADTIIIKPFDINLLVERISLYCEDKNSNTLIQKQSENSIEVSSTEKYASYALSLAGISPKLKGYVFLKDAIIMCLDDNSYIDNIIKVLYSDIAKKHNTTPFCIERNIRNAIVVSYKKNNLTEFYEYFNIPYSNKKITNKDFISYCMRKY